MPKYWFIATECAEPMRVTVQDGDEVVVEDVKAAILDVLSPHQQKLSLGSMQLHCRTSAADPSTQQVVKANLTLSELVGQFDPSYENPLVVVAAQMTAVPGKATAAPKLSAGFPKTAERNAAFAPAGQKQSSGDSVPKMPAFAAHCNSTLADTNRVSDPRVEKGPIGKAAKRSSAALSQGVEGEGAERLEASVGGKKTGGKPVCQCELFLVQDVDMCPNTKVGWSILQEQGRSRMFNAVPTRKDLVDAVQALAGGACYRGEFYLYQLQGQVDKGKAVATQYSHMFLPFARVMAALFAKSKLVVTLRAREGDVFRGHYSVLPAEKMVLAGKPWAPPETVAPEQVTDEAFYCASCRQQFQASDVQKLCEGCNRMAFVECATSSLAASAEDFRCCFCEAHYNATVGV
jgi:hypothetical protein